MKQRGTLKMLSHDVQSLRGGVQKRRNLTSTPLRSTTSKKVVTEGPLNWPESLLGMIGWMTSDQVLTVQRHVTWLREQSASRPKGTEKSDQVVSRGIALSEPWIMRTFSVNFLWYSGPWSKHRDRRWWPRACTSKDGYHATCMMLHCQQEHSFSTERKQNGTNAARENL